MRTREDLRERLRTADTPVGFTSRYLDWLDVRQVDETNWRLLHEYRFDSVAYGARIIVPEGFVTNFASVPRQPIIYLLAGGLGNGPSVLHDFIYTTQWTTKDVADHVLLEAMLTDGSAFGQPALDGWRANAMYEAVHTFGWSYWGAKEIHP